MSIYGYFVFSHVPLSSVKIGYLLYMMAGIFVLHVSLMRTWYSFHLKGLLFWLDLFEIFTPKYTSKDAAESPQVWRVMDQYQQQFMLAIKWVVSITCWMSIFQFFYWRLKGYMNIFVYNSIHYRLWILESWL